MKNFLRVLIMLFVVMNCSLASAEVVTVTGKGDYVMNRGIKETYDDAITHAEEAARRNAIEQAGVAIKTHSRTVDFELTEDVVETIAGGILEIVGKPKIYNGDTNEDGIKIICELTARIDTSKVEKFLEQKDLLAEREAKDKKIRDLEAELATYKAQGKQSEFDKTQNKFLIAKYERDLDIYDFGKKINLQDMMTTAEKLAAVDAGNSSAFRATVYVCRHEDKIQNVVDYCKEMLAANTSADISIEACAQLGDIYYNEIFDTPTAKKYVDQGIALVKKKYSKAEIEKLVNGTNVEVNNGELVGRSNTIRELYILKSDIENVNPKFDSVTVAEDMSLSEDRIYNIKYRTDW